MGKTISADTFMIKVLHAEVNAVVTNMVLWSRVFKGIERVRFASIEQAEFARGWASQHGITLAPPVEQWELMPLELCARRADEEAEREQKQVNEQEPSWEPQAGQCGFKMIRKSKGDSK